MGDSPKTLADGRYELFEAIGSGGMATVYRAYDQRLGVQRAIKVMLPSFAEKPRVRARFEAEARTMAVLDHPSIVRVYDVGSNDETAWIVMELVEGGSLLQKIGSSGISVEDCLRYTARVLEALEVAHRHEVVHRDIKPHNVLLTLDGEARITDFGIARSAGHSSESFTKTGTVMGTWAFMAPEQRVNAKGVDHTADIYGLGASLFAMATGQTPMDLFAADLDPEMLSRVPEPLLPIIRKATQYQRDQRYPTATAMLEDVTALRHRLGVNSRPVSTPVPEVAPETAPAQEPKAANVTYLPEDQETESDARARPTETGRSALSTPAIESPTPLDQELTEPSAVRLKPNRDRTVFALIVILVLVVGGTVKRLIKPSVSMEAPETPVGTVEEQPRSVDPPEQRFNELPTDPVTPEPAQPTVEPVRPPPPAEAPAPEPAGTRAEDSSEATSDEITEVTPAEPETTTAEPPALSVQVPSSVRMGGVLPLSAQIDNLRPVDVQTYSVTAYYRAVGTAAYKRTNLSRVRRTWTGKVAVTADMDGGIDIFFRAKTEASDRGLADLLRGSNTSPIRVRVSSP